MTVSPRDSGEERSKLLAEIVRLKTLISELTHISGDSEDDKNHLRAEIIRLKAAITEITEANKRWQQYNRERHGYVERLLKTIDELSALQIAQTPAEVTLGRTEVTPGHMDEQQDPRLVRELAQHHVERTPFDDDTTDDEIRLQYTDLQKRYEVCVRNICSLETENRSLKQQIKGTSSPTRYVSNIRWGDIEDSTSLSADKEHVQLLEMQVKAHRDDWMAEKEEKLAAVKEVTRLKESVQKLEQELKATKSKLHQLRYRSSASRVLSSCQCCRHHTKVEVPKSCCHHWQHCVDDTETDGPRGMVLTRGDVPSGMSVEDGDDVCTDGSVIVLTPPDSPTSQSKEDIVIDPYSDIYRTTDQTGVEMHSNQFNDINTYSSQWTDMETFQNQLNYDDDDDFCVSICDSFSRNLVFPPKQIEHLESYSQFQLIDGTVTMTEDEIVCPGCDVTFPSDRHVEFLDHFEVCQKMK